MIFLGTESVIIESIVSFWQECKLILRNVDSVWGNINISKAVYYLLNCKEDIGGGENSRFKVPALIYTFFVSTKI